MASETGTFFENYKYAVNHDLPITFVVEDNNKSVCTDTRKVWNTVDLTFNKNKDLIDKQIEQKVWNRNNNEITNFIAEGTIITQSTWSVAETEFRTEK